MYAIHRDAEEINMRLKLPSWARSQDPQWVPHPETVLDPIYTDDFHPFT